MDRDVCGQRNKEPGVSPPMASITQTCQATTSITRADDAATATIPITEAVASITQTCQARTEAAISRPTSCRVPDRRHGCPLHQLGRQRRGRRLTHRKVEDHNSGWGGVKGCQHKTPTTTADVVGLGARQNRFARGQARVSQMTCTLACERHHRPMPAFAAVEASFRRELC